MRRRFISKMFRQLPVEGLSPAMAFIVAAHNAMPSTIPDGEQATVMNDVLRTAIRCRFPFEKDDGKVLADQRLALGGNAGHFHPLAEQHYAYACTQGGTYAKAWEKQFNFKPWIAPRALIGDRYDTKVVVENRVAPGIGVLIACPQATDPDPHLSRVVDAQEWRVTSMNGEQIILCRYLTEPRNSGPSTRTPARRWTIDRAQWQAMFEAERESARRLHAARDQEDSDENAEAFDELVQESHEMVDAMCDPATDAELVERQRA